MKYGDIVLERYQLEAPLGSGGSSEVWRALDLTTETLVAVKLARTGQAAVSHGSVAAEAAILSSLDHPNIVRVLDSGSEGDRAVLVMELLDGPTLREHLRESGAMSDAEVAGLGFALADALANLHAQGFIHGDIKPENIILSGGLAKLVDFGTARDFSETLSLEELRQISGTLAYLAPELLIGEPHSPQSDLYALGVTLYEARSGRLPFSGGGGILAGAEGRRVRPLRDVVPGVDSRLAAPIMQSLAVDVAFRPRSAGDVRDELTNAGQPTINLRPQKRSGTKSRDARRPNPMVAPMAAAPVAVAGPAMVAGPGRRASSMSFEEWQEERYPRRTMARRLVMAVVALLLLGTIGTTAFLTLDGGEEDDLAGSVESPKEAVIAAADADTATSTTVSTATASATRTQTQTIQPTPTPEPPSATATAVPPTATAPPPAPTTAPPAPAPAPASEPLVQLNSSAGVDTVIRWYDLLVAGQFDSAYALWSERMKANFPRQGNLDSRWANTTSVSINEARVVSQSGNRMTVAVDFVETLANGTSRRYAGTWQLTASPNGWLLDQPSF